MKFRVLQKRDRRAIKENGRRFAAIRRTGNADFSYDAKTRLVRGNREAARIMVDSGMRVLDLWNRQRERNAERSATRRWKRVQWLATQLGRRGVSYKRPRRDRC